jgi:hypothetical protein
LICLLFLLILTILACNKQSNCPTLKKPDNTSLENLVEDAFNLMLKSKNICVYNILSKNTQAKYDLYSFATIAESFPFKRAVFNLKYYSKKTKCKSIDSSHINCIIYFGDAEIPIFFKKEKSEFIDENTGKIKKEERISLELDFDFYLELFNQLNKKYNIDIFYDYYRKRGG